MILGRPDRRASAVAERYAPAEMIEVDDNDERSYSSIGAVSGAAPPAHVSYACSPRTTASQFAPRTRRRRREPTSRPSRRAGRALRTRSGRRRRSRASARLRCPPEAERIAVRSNTRATRSCRPTRGRDCSPSDLRARRGAGTSRGAEQCRAGILPRSVDAVLRRAGRRVPPSETNRVTARPELHRAAVVRRVVRCRGDHVVAKRVHAQVAVAREVEIAGQAPARDTHALAPSVWCV